MKISKLIIIFCLLFVFIPVNIVKAQTKGVTEIVTTNIQLSINEFFKKTTADLVQYYKSQFDFSSNIVKNLIEENYLWSIFNTILKYGTNEANKFINSLTRYKNLITPSEIK